MPGSSYFLPYALMHVVTINDEVYPVKKRAGKIFSREGVGG